ncbi:MAG TPA: hypothetical protein VIX91_12365 [Candidatus Acidoferrum sp.]
MDRSSCESIWLPAGVQPVHVRFIFVRADVRVDKKRVHESKHRTEKQNQRQYCRVPNAADLPAFATSKRAFKGPAQQSEENKNDDGKIEQVPPDVMKDISVEQSDENPG